MSCNNIDAQEPLKPYVLKFTCDGGNGWAFVNAYNVQQAQTVFKKQTKYSNVKVNIIKEVKYFGEEIQLVFEGATIDD